MESAVHRRRDDQQAASLSTDDSMTVDHHNAHHEASCTAEDGLEATGFEEGGEQQDDNEDDAAAAVWICAVSSPSVASSPMHRVLPSRFILHLELAGGDRIVVRICAVSVTLDCGFSNLRRTWRPTQLPTAACTSSASEGQLSANFDLRARTSSSGCSATS